MELKAIASKGDYSHEIVKSAQESEANQTKKDSSTTLSEEKHNKTTKEEIKKAVSEINDQLKLKKTRSEFTYHEDINRVSIKVIDAGTEKVIKEIPSESTIDMVKELWKQAGILIDETC